MPRSFISRYPVPIYDWNVSYFFDELCFGFEPLLTEQEQKVFASGTLLFLDLVTARHNEPIFSALDALTLFGFGKMSVTGKKTNLIPEERKSDYEIIEIVFNFLDSTVSKKSGLSEIRKFLNGNRIRDLIEITKLTPIPLRSTQLFVCPLALAVKEFLGEENNLKFSEVQGNVKRKSQVPISLLGVDRKEFHYNGTNPLERLLGITKETSWSANYVGDIPDTYFSVGWDSKEGWRVEGDFNGEQIFYTRGYANSSLEEVLQTSCLAAGKNLTRKFLNGIAEHYKNPIAILPPDESTVMFPDGVFLSCFIPITAKGIPQIIDCLASLDSRNRRKIKIAIGLASQTIYAFDDLPLSDTGLFDNKECLDSGEEITRPVYMLGILGPALCIPRLLCDLKRFCNSNEDFFPVLTDATFFLRNRALEVTTDSCEITWTLHGAWRDVFVQENVANDLVSNQYFLKKIALCLEDFSVPTIQKSNSSPLVAEMNKLDEDTEEELEEDDDAEDEELENDVDGDMRVLFVTTLLNPFGPTLNVFAYDKESFTPNGENEIFQFVWHPTTKTKDSVGSLHFDGDYPNSDAFGEFLDTTFPEICFDNVYAGKGLTQEQADLLATKAAEIDPIEKMKLVTLYPDDVFARFDSQMGKTKEEFEISPEDAKEKLKNFYLSEESLEREFRLWFNSLVSCYRFFYRGAAAVSPEEIFSFLKKECSMDVPAVSTLCQKK